MPVRAMFRVLSTSRNYDKQPLIKLGPTYQTRDGVQCEENKSFSKWTPSGDCELSVEPGELFLDGAYLYVDFYTPEEAPEPPANGVRVQMQLSRFEVDATGPSFCARMFSYKNIRGSLSMTVTNLAPLVVALFRLEPGEGPRSIVIDFSPA